MSCGLVVGASGICAEPQLVLTLEPDSVVPELLMVALPPAPHCIASPEWISRLVFAVISIDWATMVMSSVGVWKHTSPSIASIVILLAWLSNVILALPAPSSMISFLFSSSNVILEPWRDLIVRRGTPPGFLSGGLSLPFHR